MNEIVGTSVWITCRWCFHALQALEETPTLRGEHERGVEGRARFNPYDVREWTDQDYRASDGVENFETFCCYEHQEAFEAAHPDLRRIPRRA